MEPFGQSDVDADCDRPQQPQNFGQPVAKEGPEHGEGVDGGAAFRSPAARAPSEQTNGRLGNRSGLDAPVSSSARIHAADANGLEALGVGSGESGSGLAGEISAGLKRRKRSRRLKLAVADDGSVNPHAVMLLIERQRFRCALSDRPLTPETASLDHIVPVCRGGEHRIGNTQVLDRLVNRAKGTLTNEEFIALCGEVWRHTQAQRRNDKHASTAPE